MNLNLTMFNTCQLISLNISMIIGIIKVRSCVDNILSVGSIVHTTLSNQE